MSIQVQCPHCKGTHIRAVEYVIQTTTVREWRRDDSTGEVTIDDYADDATTDYDGADPAPQPYDCAKCLVALDTADLVVADIEEEDLGS